MNNIDSTTYNYLIFGWMEMIPSKCTDPIKIQGPTLLTQINFNPNMNT